MPDRKWAMKMQRPMPYRADSLWRRCLFATPLYTYGYALGGLLADNDSVAGIRGVWVVQPTDASHFPRLSSGRAYSTDTALTLGVRPGWSAAGDNRYSVTADWTTAVLVQPYVLSALPTTVFYKRRATPYAAANAGWTWANDVGNVWRITVCDGVAECTALSVAAAVVGRSDLLVATWTASTNALRLYMNGQLVATTVVALGSINPAVTQNINLLGISAAGNLIYNGAVGMAAEWSRVLSFGEIARLQADPFAMWRLPADPEGIDGEVGLSPQTFFLAF